VRDFFNVLGKLFQIVLFFSCGSIFGGCNLLLCVILEISLCLIFRWQNPNTYARIFKWISSNWSERAWLKVGVLWTD